MSFKELIKVANYYQEKYFNKYSKFGGVKSKEEAPFRLLLDDFGIAIIKAFSEKELEIFNPDNVGDSWRKYLEPLSYEYYKSLDERLKISQIKVMLWLKELKNNPLFKNKELLKEVDLNSLIQKVESLDSEKLNKDFYQKEKFAQYDEILDKPSYRDEKDNFDQLLKMYRSGFSIDEITETKEYKDLSRSEKILLEKILNPKPIKPIRYFGDE